MDNFQAKCLPALIGSLPMDNHEDATKLVLDYAPEIPLWVQLPVFREEGMVPQFIPGMPGKKEVGGKIIIDTSNDDFENEILSFYNDYLDITEGGGDLDSSRFAMTDETAKGFFEFIRQIGELPNLPYALKGQITGPVTMGTGLVDQDGRAVFYNDQVRDAVVKQLALKAKWQVKKLAPFERPVIIFFDEPVLAGYGSSAFLSITKDHISSCFEEVFSAVHDEGGYTGVHVCANTDWSLILDSSADIVSFDAYSYFDNFLLFPDQIKKFISKGGILAWGIVPTTGEYLSGVTAESLTEKWIADVEKLQKLGIDIEVIKNQSLITPSCGTGSLSLDEAKKVLDLTKRVSEKVRG